MATSPKTRPVTTPSNSSCRVNQAGEHRGQPPSRPRNTARARSSRSSSSRAVALEADLALLEEDRPVGHGEGHVERLLDDDDRHALALQPLDDAEQLLDHDRREAEGQLVDEQDLGLVQQHARRGRASAAGRPRASRPPGPAVRPGPRRGRAPWRCGAPGPPRRCGSTNAAISRFSRTVICGKTPLPPGQQADAHARRASRARRR